MNVIGEWSWNARTVDNAGRKIRQFFNAGEHVLEVSGRSRGHAIDRIALFHYNTNSFSRDRFERLAHPHLHLLQPPHPLLPQLLLRALWPVGFQSLQT